MDNVLGILQPRVIEETSGYPSHVSDIPSDYLAHYKLDGDVTDESGNYNGTNSGVAFGTDRQGQASKAGVFVKSEVDYFTAPTSLFERTVMSISGWFKVDTNPGTGVIYIINCEETSGDSDSEWINFGVNSTGTCLLQLREDSTTSVSINTTNTYDNAGWHFFCITIDIGNDIVTLQIDDEKVEGDISSLSLTYSSFAVCKIGGRVGSSTVDRHLDGKLDDIRVYNYVLSERQIRSLRNEKTLIANYPFNGNVNDVSGNGFNLTNNGADLTTGRFGNNNMGYDFVAANTDYMVSTSIISTLQEHSIGAISLWLKPDSVAASSQETILCFGDVSDSYFIIISFNNTKLKASCRQGSSSSDNWTIVTDLALSTGNLYHIVLIQDGSRPYFYVNGKKQSDTIEGDNGTSAYGRWFNESGLFSIDSFQIGRLEQNGNGGAQYIDGEVYDVKVYSKALSQKEVLDLYFEAPYNVYNYGFLYNWHAIDTDKLAPTGWHVPTDEEWKTLEEHLGMSSAEADAALWRGTDEGDKLKSKGNWDSSGGGTNEVGFTALSSGWRYYSDGSFYNLGGRAYFWSSTSYDEDTAWFRCLWYSNSKVYRNGAYHSHGLSVRCVKNDSNTPGRVTDIDGNVYKTVKIGDQVWMAENLRTTKYNDGVAISNITNNATWVGLSSGAYCIYNNDSEPDIYNER